MTVARAKHTLSQPDYRIMRHLNRWQAPRWFRWWMLLATRAGDGWLWGSIGLALLFSSDPMRYVAILSASGAVAAGIFLFLVLKRLVGRKRPRDIEPHCWANIVTSDRFSFPSGHSTTAFAVAVSLGSFFPDILPILLLLAANVALSRIIVGMHFLSDVLVGSGIGATLGYVAYRFAA